MSRRNSRTRLKDLGDAATPLGKRNYHRGSSQGTSIDLLMGGPQGSEAGPCVEAYFRRTLRQRNKREDI